MSRLEWRCCMALHVIFQYLAAVASGQTAVAAAASTKSTQTASTFDSSSFGNQPIISMGPISFACSGRQWVDDMGWGTGPEVSRKSWADCANTVAVSGCPLSSMSPPPQAGSEGREMPCPTRPGPTRPGPGPPPSPHPLSRPLFHPDSLPGPGCSWLPSHCQGPCLQGGERQRQGQGGPRRAEEGCWAGGQPGGGGLRVPVITPPEGLGGGAGRTPNPNTCKTHARTQAHAHRHKLGGGRGSAQ
jgi:hypothetical protein